MVPGMKITTLVCFSDLERTWGVPYPKLGEEVTIRSVRPHDVPDIAALGVKLLLLEEYPHLFVGVCDKQANGTLNFGVEN